MRLPPCVRRDSGPQRKPTPANRNSAASAKHWPRCGSSLEPSIEERVLSDASPNPLYPNATTGITHMSAPSLEPLMKFHSRYFMVKIGVAADAVFSNV